MTYPTEAQRVAIQAFLGGYLDTQTDVAFAAIKTVVEKHFPTTKPVDGMMLSRMLRRLGFAKNHDAADAATPTYRRVLRPEEVPY